ncbi:hypothetical protein XFF6166_490082 [Xanthomonas citri pv. fuscans]|nr:hypothetical protein XFF6166_490082 [Xanthomonas citri pv. fuscans]SOO00968.1 hypothetical protein XFF7767_1080100 [Xanthomonas citri pv. fuscans]SOO01259.1 hypothetical protein XFF6960_460082 [Xanthomonas citri pv. fuscans]SOO10785.1 hypothetical protein XFF6970_660007 [Xanthomonas citri pv. fuscans]SOO14343.1 hypothetical protein XFF7766_30083 [Xanthomonas citri pv. fuscans]
MRKSAQSLPYGGENCRRSALAAWRIHPPTAGHARWRRDARALVVAQTHLNHVMVCARGRRV